MRRELLAAAVFVAGCATVDAPVIAPGPAPADAAAPLSRADCVRLATNYAPTAAAWNARFLSARAALRQAGAFANPTASLGWENLGLAGTPIQSTLTLAYSLASLAQRPRQKAAAQYDVDATRADLLAEKSKLAADVCHGYDDLVAARRRVELEAESVAVAERAHDAAVKFVAAGTKAGFEADRAAAEVVKARSDEASATAEARAQELSFAFALGFDRPVALQMNEGLLSGPVVDAAAAMAAAAQRPEIASADARLHAALERANLAAERFQFLPTVTGGPRREGTDTSGVLSLDVELPVFDSGAAAADAASADVLAAAAALRKSAHDVAAEVLVALDRAVSAESFLREHARPLADARRALREKSERLLAAGEIEFDEVIQASRDEAEARASLLDAELAASRAIVDLDAAMGRPADSK